MANEVKVAGGFLWANDEDGDRVGVKLDTVAEFFAREEGLATIEPRDARGVMDQIKLTCTVEDIEAAIEKDAAKVCERRTDYTGELTVKTRSDRLSFFERIMG